MSPRLRYHVAEDGEFGERGTARSAEAFRGVAPPGTDEVLDPSFNSDEAAARFFLDELLQRDDRPTMRSITEPDRPEQLPGLRLAGAQDLPATQTRLVRFTQAHRDIPIFGSRAVVELTRERHLVSADAQLQEVGNVSPVESLSRADALDRVVAFTGSDIPPEAAASAELNFFEREQDGADAWHLAWFFKDLPAAPPREETELGGHGLGARPFRPRYNYLVDAHNGEILFFFSSDPTVLETPVRCSGMDEEGATVSFWGRRDTDEFQLSDPLRRIRTYDLEFADLQTDPPLPSEPIAGPDSEFDDDHRAGVSAHFNATRVLDFYKSILQRNGIDDAGMVLISLVNCTYAKQPGSVELKNAFWSDKKMWYGQVRQGDRLVSLSRCLDVIAHELTHGVVESTSGLVYKNQSGALNESFADIFGIMVKNWYLADKADVGTWNWELGSGLGRDGLPLRDMKDPQRIGYPAHMDDFVQTQQDGGGVHINSNIHNKAAYNVLTTDDNGARVFSPEDAAVLFYLGMARLQPLAKFTDARQAVIDVALTYFAGHPDQKKKLDALQDAYAQVGIV